MHQRECQYLLIVFYGSVVMILGLASLGRDLLGAIGASSIHAHQVMSLVEGHLLKCIAPLKHVDHCLEVCSQFIRVDCYVSR